MKDNARIEKGDLIIDVGELVDNLSQDQKDTLAKTAAFKDAYSRTIVQLICEDSTEDGWHIWSASNNPLTKARIAILERLGDVEREVIRDLLDKKAAAQANEKRMDEAYWGLYHWRELRECNQCGKRTTPPKMPDFVSGDRIPAADIDIVASSRDLLAACKIAVEWLEAVEATEGKRTYSPKDKIKAAIEKAESQESLEEAS